MQNEPPFVSGQALSLPTLSQLSPVVSSLSPSIFPLPSRVLRFLPRIERIIGEHAVVIIICDGQSWIIPVPPVPGDWQSGSEQSFAVLGRVNLNAPGAKVADLPRSESDSGSGLHWRERSTGRVRLTLATDERPQSVMADRLDYTFHTLRGAICPHSGKPPARVPR